MKVCVGNRDKPIAILDIVGPFPLEMGFQLISPAAVPEKPKCEYCGLISEGVFTPSPHLTGMNLRAPQAIVKAAAKTISI